MAVAVPMIQETQALHPDFRVCSFDRGFHSPENRVQLDDLLDLNALPRKGRHNRADREREAEEAFAGARQQHPAVESAINNLEHRGLDRVRSHGAEGFAQTVALSVPGRQPAPHRTAVAATPLNDAAPPDRLPWSPPSPRRETGVVSRA